MAVKKSHIYWLWQNVFVYNYKKLSVSLVYHWPMDLLKDGGQKYIIFKLELRMTYWDGILPSLVIMISELEFEPMI